MTLLEGEVTSVSEGDSEANDSASPFIAWTIIGSGLFFALYSFGFLWIGLEMLFREYNAGYPTWPGIVWMLVWIFLLLMGVLMIRWGRRILQTVKKEQLSS
jgi:hypothetical protein